MQGICCKANSLWKILVHFFRMSPCCVYKTYIMSKVCCLWMWKHSLPPTFDIPSWSDLFRWIFWNHLTLVISNSFNNPFNFQFWVVTFPPYIGLPCLVNSNDKDRHYCCFPGVLEYVSFGFVVSMMVASGPREFTFSGQENILPLLGCWACLWEECLDSVNVSYVTLLPLLHLISLIIFSVILEIADEYSCFVLYL